jgi:uncharacterized membrane protein YccC
MLTMLQPMLDWIKANKIIAAIIGIALAFVLFPRQLKRMLGITKRRVHHRRVVPVARRRRSLPRSVGIRKQYNKSGRAKKPWQIKGSEAARRHMRKIRAMR